jgi:hypothetical protein
MAAHESPRTTKLYDRTKERLTQDEVGENTPLKPAVGSFDYGFDFVPAGVPEPASNAGLLTGLAILAAVGGFALRNALRAAPPPIGAAERPRPVWSCLKGIALPLSGLVESIFRIQSGCGVGGDDHDPGRRRRATALALDLPTFSWHHRDAPAGRACPPPSLNTDRFYHIPQLKRRHG